MAGTVAGSLIFDTKTDTSGFQKGTKTINNQAKELSNSFNGVGKAVVAAFSVAAIKEFGTKLIETTANLKSLDAQFEQIFKGAEGAEAMKLINEQSDELGIHADRLKESFSKFGAQVKGSGMEASKVMEATKIATKNAADAAAFYDVSLETASESLASLMKGNFEAGDAIGVFTNATQMSAAATREYGVSWDKLNEAQKQSLILDKVTEVYKLNGAVDQSVREQNNWENSVGNFEATWNRFLQNIGTPVLDSVNLAVQKITDGLSALTTFMQNNTSVIDNFKLAIEGLTVAFTTYFIVTSRWTILQNFLAITLKLETAVRAFGVALMSPIAQMALAAAAIVMLISLATRLQNAWGSMTGTQKVVSAIAGVTAAALAGAMAVGMFQTAMSRGIAAVGIVAGIVALTAAITAAEAKVKAASNSATGGSGYIPHLATGAVIPANGEFMAVLGDQKYGKNLEAPEGLIRQIMREELGSRGNGGSGNITTVIQLDGRELARATAPYNTGENMRQGVRLINGVT